MKLDKYALKLVADCGFTAWHSLPDGRESNSALSNIKQKSKEPYEDFASWLSEAVQRIISDSEAAGILTKQLAFENANSTCQAILHPLKKSGEVGDFIRQCANVGPAMMQGIAIAAAIKGDSYQQTVQSFLTGKNNPKNYSSNQGWNAGLSKACMSCGQEGHFTRACPQRTAYSYLPNPASTAMTLNLPKTPVLIVRRDITG